MIRPVFLVTDCFYYGFLILLTGMLWWFRRRHAFQELKSRLHGNPMSKGALIIVFIYLMIALADSIHFRIPALDADQNNLMNEKGETVYGPTRSLLDSLLVKTYAGIRLEAGRINTHVEDSYSTPLSHVSFEKEIVFLADQGKTELKTKPLLAPGAHFLGTDKAGGDIFYQILKGVRTGIIVGLVTTFIAVPFAILFGISAGYFGGRIDDCIQFIYTTVSSIPSILLIVSLIMIVDTKLKALSTADILFRDDLRVFGICCILGVLGWSSLCRILRAETLKIKTLDYVQSAKILGASPLRIMMRHILPNVMHLILITFILSFSGLVMVEVILQYINIGVPSTVASWGRIIDDARSELGRDPMILWPVVSAFTAMFVLIFSVNVLGDTVRDAFDPKLRGSGDSQ